MRKFSDISNKGKLRRQQGASLMEYMLWTGLSAVAIVGSVMAYQAANSGTSSNGAVQEVLGIRSGMKTLRGVSANYAGQTMAALNTAKVLPTSLTVSGSNAVSTSGVTYSLDLTSTTTPGVVASLPSDVCIKLLSNLDPTWAYVGTSTNTLPLSQSTISTLCTGSGGANPSVSLYFS